MFDQLAPLFIPAGPELAILAGVIVLLFGTHKIPELGNAVGRSLGEFKRGRLDDGESLEDET